tara:strand:+ start:790 stop:1554 length:765 start_codon:yes stop_codon:yes gene_type:complete
VIGHLIAWPKNGLGDRIKLTASAWAASESMGRSFAIRWIPGRGCDAHWKDLFQDNMATFCGDRDRCYEGHNHQDLHKEGLLKRYEGKQVNDIKDSEHRWIEACSGYFCNGWNHKEILNPYLKKMIAPIPSIKQDISKIKENFTGNTIGVHIRRTYGGYPSKTFTKIDEFIDTYADSRVFVCVDTPSDIHEFKKYGGRLIHAPQSNKNRTVEGMREALVDFCLLSSCQEMIGTINSSFSQMAEMFNTTKREMVLL